MQKHCYTVELNKKKKCEWFLAGSKSVPVYIVEFVRFIYSNPDHKYIIYKRINIVVKNTREKTYKISWKLNLMSHKKHKH